MLFAPASGCRSNPALYGPCLLRFLLHGSWLSQAVHGRCDGSRGTAALDRGAQHSRKSWLENASEAPRALRSAAQGTEIYCQTRSQRETASSTLPRDKKRSFIDAATFGPHRSRDMTARPRRRQNRTQQSPWKSPASNRPPSPDSGRDAGRRRGRAPGVERNLRFETPRFRARAFTLTPRPHFHNHFASRAIARAGPRAASPQQITRKRRPRTTTSRPRNGRTSRHDRRRDASSSRPTTPCPPTGARKGVGTCDGGSSGPWWAWTASSSPNSATSRPG